MRAPRVTADGVRTVAQQELRRRVRAGRWRWLLGAWFVVVTGFTALMYLATDQITGPDRAARGAVMYGGLVVFVLALALLVVPALAGQSVNGDRERGTLAVLQVTRLTPSDIALGKLAAAWGTALVFLALTLPPVLWCLAAGGVRVLQVVVVTLVLGLVLGIVCAVALALSALLARTTTSGVLSYLAVFTLTVGTLVGFGLATVATTEDQLQTVPGGFTCTSEPPRDFVPSGPDDVPPGCTALPPQTFTAPVAHTERTWWLLAPNPFVVVADVAPPTPKLRQSSLLDPLGGIGRAVRDARRGPVGTPTVILQGNEEPRPPVGAVWPWGLAADLLLAGGAVLLTVRRLTTPTRRLPRGARVA